MYDRVEAFYRPATVREALLLLQRGKGSARIVAGCTDVLAGSTPGPERPIRFLIDITRAGLSYIRKRSGAWTIGATTTMSEIEESAELRAIAGGLLVRAAAACGSVEVRNMATVGGNMANGSPAADLATPLLALDATVTVAGARGRRKVPLATYKAAARELLVEIGFLDPPRRARCGWSFQKLGRTALDISIVNVAAGLQLDARGRVKWARIALGAVAPAAMRMTEIEDAMAGRPLDSVLIGEVSKAVMGAVNPIGDVRAPAEYRREITRVLTVRALEECASHAGVTL